MTEVRAGGLEDARVIALLEAHARGMLANSPRDSCHFLDLTALKAPEVTFWTVWDGEALLGCGALKELDPAHGEIKSMRTDPEHLRRGVGAALLERILATARERGYKRLSLETGTGPAFEAAHGLYRRFGFTECGAFGGYPEGDSFSRFMTRVI